MLVPEPEDALLPVPDLDVTRAPSPSSTPLSTNAATPTRVSTPPPQIAPTSLFQSMGDEQSDQESDAASLPDMHQVNNDWAKLSLQLEDLRLVAGGGKTKGKKGKGVAVIMETPGMRHLKEEIGALEKDYMFSRRAAGMSSSGSY